MHLTVRGTRWMHATVDNISTAISMRRKVLATSGEGSILCKISFYIIVVLFQTDALAVQYHFMFAERPSCKLRNLRADRAGTASLKSRSHSIAQRALRIFEPPGKNDPDSILRLSVGGWSGSRDCNQRMQILDVQDGFGGRAEKREEGTHPRRIAKSDRLPIPSKIPPPSKSQPDSLIFAVEGSWKSESEDFGAPYTYGMARPK